MTPQTKSWLTYEQIAQVLLDQVAEVLGFARVEGKQLLVGETGTTWEVDGKAVKIGDQGIGLVECKQWQSRVSQETVAGFAFRIDDVGASGGVLVSPLGLQSGAKKVAGATGIVEVRLNSDANLVDYVLVLDDFLNRAFVGVGFGAEATLSVKVVAVGDVTVSEANTSAQSSTFPIAD